MKWMRSCEGNRHAADGAFRFVLHPLEEATVVEKVSARSELSAVE